MPRRLELSDKAVELMAYLTMHHRQATDTEIVRALWPRKTHERGVELLRETVAELNAAAAAATGRPVVAGPGQDLGSARSEPSARLYLRIMGEPCVEVYEPHEPFPGELDW
jgi:hypothetical protein